MPLNEVEAFVKAEKHLPNIPSEQTMKAEGIDLAEMNAKMMEKIEELTLYLIQQNKNTEELKKELEALKEKLAEQEKAEK
jgi:vacuolar-type H+-ATPase subunit I/STV1